MFYILDPSLKMYIVDTDSESLSEENCSQLYHHIVHNSGLLAASLKQWKMRTVIPVNWIPTSLVHTSEYHVSTISDTEEQRHKEMILLLKIQFSNAFHNQSHI